MYYSDSDESHHNDGYFDPDLCVKCRECGKIVPEDGEWFICGGCEKVLCLACLKYNCVVCTEKRDNDDYGTGFLEVESCKKCAVACPNQCKSSRGRSVYVHECCLTEHLGGCNSLSRAEKSYQSAKARREDMERALPRAISELACAQRRVDQLKTGIEEAMVEEKRAKLQLKEAMVSDPMKAKSQSEVSRPYTSHKLMSGKQHLHGQTKLLDSTNTMSSRNQCETIAKAKSNGTIELAGRTYGTVGASSFYSKLAQSTNRVNGNSLSSNHDYSHSNAKLRAQVADLRVSRR